MIIRGTEYSDSYPFLSYAKRNMLDYGTVLHYVDEYLDVYGRLGWDPELVACIRNLTVLSQQSCEDIEMIVRSTMVGRMTA